MTDDKCVRESNNQEDRSSDSGAADQHSKRNDSGIRASNISIRIGNRRLLESADFEISPGSFTLIVGISGSGKSTLLRVVAGLESPAELDSSIQWDGSLKFSPGTSPSDVGFVFQKPALLDELTSRANIQLASDHASKTNTNTKTPEQWLQHFHIPATPGVSQLSGGQRQRLSLACSLATQPKIIFFDEPTTGLDPETSRDVAQFLSTTCESNGLTSVVVTHDIDSFVEFADQVLLVDPNQKNVLSLGQPTGKELHGMLADQITTQVTNRGVVEISFSSPLPNRITRGLLDWFAYIGDFLVSAVMMLIAILPLWRSPIWGMRFLIHYFRLVSGLTAVFYLCIAGLIAGFVTTYFTLEYMPYRMYTEPLLSEELIAAIGFALYRIFVPVLSTVLIASRSTAAVAADLGNKRYGGQIEMLRMSGVPYHSYFRSAVLISFLAGTLLLNFVAFYVARWSSLLATTVVSKEIDPIYWTSYFHSTLVEPNQLVWNGTEWLAFKLLISAFCCSTVTYHFSMRRKLASTDVSRSITSVILFSTICVLVVHFLVALFEFA